MADMLLCTCCAPVPNAICHAVSKIVLWNISLRSQIWRISQGPGRSPVGAHGRRVDTACGLTGATALKCEHENHTKHSWNIHTNLINTWNLHENITQVWQTQHRLTHLWYELIRTEEAAFAFALCDPLCHRDSDCVNWSRTLEIWSGYDTRLYLGVGTTQHLISRKPSDLRAKNMLLILRSKRHRDSQPTTGCVCESEFTCHSAQLLTTWTLILKERTKR